MSLASLADVAAELGLADEYQLTEVQKTRTPGLLVKASFAFRQEAGRQFIASTYTHRVQVVGGRALLPESPVTAVDAVVDDSGNTVQYTRNGDWLNVSGHHNHVNSFASYQPSETGWFVTATYQGGGVPDIVKVTVAQIVARHLNVDPSAAMGVKYLDQTMGPLNVRKQFFDWAAETVTLTPEERAVARAFRAGPAPIIHRC